MSDDISASKQIREGPKQRRARVLYSYNPVNDDELELQVNDIVKVIEEVEEGWWRGILKGKEGVFPSNFVLEDNTDVFESSKGTEKQEEKENPSLIDVTDGAKLSSPSHQEIKPKPVQGVGLGNIFQDGVKKLKPTEIASEKKPSGLPKKPPPPAPLENAPRLPPKPVREQARVLYLYEAQNEDELSMKEGDIINIISKEVEDKGWWKGELNGQIGVFPDNFVELIRAEEVQLRRPERPEKPSMTVLGAKNTKQDVPEKPFPLQEVASAEKASKLPPPKPPAPLSLKREEKSEKQTPPIPGKKPQLPPPMMKKPNRSSLGPKPAAINVTSSTTVPSNQNSVQSPTSTTQLMASVLTNGAVSLSDDVKAKSFQQEAQDNIDESTFDAIESSPEKLTHLAASRAKAPNRRPPSRIFVNKENDKENGDIGMQQPAWFKDVSKGQNIISSQSESSLGDKEIVQTVEDQKKDSPKRKTPAPLSPNVTEHKEEEIKAASKPTAPVSPAKEAATLSPVNVEKPEQEADTSKSIPDVTASDELSDLRKEICLLQESTVRKSDFEELQRQIEALKEAVESQRNHFSKLVVDLISEIDEEKKLRLALEVQLDRIKKLTATV